MADLCMSDPQMDAASLLAGTARLFRSVHAGRSWARQVASQVHTSDVNGCFVLKSGDASTPLFMLPGAPGSVLQLAALAQHLDIPGRVYAIKPKGYEEGEVPYERLEEMAAHNIAIMRSVQPHGPYFLLGYSVGGLVALEMAASLVAKDDVPIVFLLDTYPNRRNWPLSCHARILLGSAFRSLFELFGTTQSEDGPLRSRWESLAWYLSQCGVPGVPAPPLVPEGVSPASRRLHAMSVQAGDNYTPKPYDGKVVFVQPNEIPNLEPKLPHQVWRKWLSDLDVDRVSGSHLTMVEADAAATAAAVAERVRALMRGNASATRDLAERST